MAERSKRFRVLVVTGSLVLEECGPFFSILEACLALDKCCFVDRLTLIGTKRRGEVVNTALYEPCDVQAFLSTGPFNYHFAPAGFRWLRRNLSRFDIVIVQGLWSVLHLEAMRIAAYAGVPYMVVPRGSLNAFARRKSRWVKQLVETVYRKAIAGVGLWQALTMEEVHAIRAYSASARIAMIPNGIPRIASGGLESFQRSETNRRTLLYLGRIAPIKNLDGLLDAWRRSQQLWPSWKLILAGTVDGRYAQDLVSTYRDLVCRDAIEFVGPRFGDDKRAMFSRADVFILPSHSEGLPMAALEAASLGIPCALTRQCGLNEMIDGEAAFEIAGDSASLAGDLHRLLTLSDSERLGLGARGAKFVAESFSWEAVTERYHGVFDWLCGTRRDRPASIDVTERFL